MEGCEKRKLIIQSRKSADQVTVEVQDSGKGMSSEQMTHIFESFYTTKKRGSGTGLGLSICKQIVSELKGEIKVESEEEKGTRFHVVLNVRGPKRSQV